MSYQQLTEGKRYQIAALIAQGLRPSEIARIINVHRSTVYRELRGNRRERQYDPAQAHALTQQRRRCSAKYRVPQDTIDFVELTLSWEWSPEQISGVSHRIGMPVSHEWIYRYVAADKARGGKLYQRFRQGRKGYQKGVNSKRSVIPNPRSIENRPVVVETRERFGNWDVDTVLGKHGTGALVTLAERKSRIYLVKRVDSKRAIDVREMAQSLLSTRKLVKHWVSSFTLPIPIHRGSAG